MRKILFLDIDGVLNSRHWMLQQVGTFDENYENFMDPQAVALLENLVQQTLCEVVLSSAWRISPGVQEAQRALTHHGFTARIQDHTPSLRYSMLDDEQVEKALGPLRFSEIRDGTHALDREHRRGLEIEIWLRRNVADLASVCIAIVDDSSDMGALRPRLVQTHERYGLQPEHLPLLAKQLQTPLGDLLPAHNSWIKAEVLLPSAAPYDSFA